MRDTVDLPERVRCWAGEGRVVGVAEDFRSDVTDPLDRMLRVAVDGETYRTLESDATPVG